MRIDRAVLWGCVTATMFNAVTDSGAADTELSPSRVVDAADQPIAGATIEFTTQLKYPWLESPEPLAAAVTNEQGEFTYPETLPDLDDFFVIVNAEGFLERFWTANRNVYRKQDGVRLPDTLTLLRPATIAGTIIDEQGHPLPDADIYVDYYFDAGSASIGGNMAKSDANGRFTATNVPPANVFVRYQSPSSYAAGEWPGPIGMQPVKFCIAYLQPTDGQTIDDVVLDLRTANCVVEGRVVDQVGQGVSGVAVKAGYFPAVQRIDETIAVKTDADGGFRFTGLTPDTFVIWVPHSGPSDTVKLSNEKSISVALTMPDPVLRGREPTPDDPERTAWGEPNADGLVAGIRLAPPAKSLAIGDLIQVHLVVRNPTSEKKALDYSFSGQADLHAINSEGQAIARINYFHYTGVNVRRSYSLAAGHEATIGSFEVGLTAAGDTDNSPPPIRFPIACRPGEQLVLRYYLSQGPDHEWTTGDASLECDDKPPAKKPR